MNQLAYWLIVSVVWYMGVAIAYWFGGEEHALILFWVGTAVQVCCAIYRFTHPKTKVPSRTWWQNPYMDAIGFGIAIFALNLYFTHLGWSPELVERLTCLMIGKEALFWIRDRLI
jgi:hypothetical protein